MSKYEVARLRALIPLTAVAMGMVSLCSSPSFALGETSLGMYRSYEPMAVVSPDAPSETLIASCGWLYRVISESEERLVLRFVSFRPCDATRSDSTEAVNTRGTYEIEREVWEAKPLTREFVQGLHTGVLLVPFKLHFSNASAPSRIVVNATLGGSIGHRWEMWGWGWLVPQVFVGYAPISISDDASSAAKDVGGISWGYGVVLDLRSAFQLGIVGGWDHASGPDGREWPYQNRYWMSFAINYQLMKRPGS